jgi:hypothetical protein
MIADPKPRFVAAQKNSAALSRPHGRSGQRFRHFDRHAAGR